MTLADIAGYIAATCGTIAFAPQAIMTWKTRKVDGISLGTYSFFTFAVFMWLVYGILIMAWPVIIANALTLVLASFILVMKIRYTVAKPPSQ